jgi:hypothetical protein
MRTARTRLLGGSLVTALAASTLTAAGGAVADGGTADLVSRYAAQAKTSASTSANAPPQITLITGDRVTMGPRGSVGGAALRRAARASPCPFSGPASTPTSYPATPWR